MTLVPIQDGGTVDNYGSIIELCRSRLAELGISYSTLDQLAGWTDTYSTKVLAPTPIKRLSIDMLFVLLGSLGLEMQIVPNAEATERLRNHRYFEHRKHMLTIDEHRIIKLCISKKEMRRRSKLAALGRLQKILPHRRQAIARHAAIIRWDKVKAAVRARDSSAKA